jgi:hypothetical protein
MVFARGITEMSDSRVAFEMWAAFELMEHDFEMGEHGEYLDDFLQQSWLGWNAARAQDGAVYVSPAPHYETQRGLSCKSDTQSAVVPSGVWQFYQDGEWHTGMNNIRHRADTEAAGYKVRDLWVNQEQDPFN